eukprot:1913778-Rhodomonas_salina.1
MRVTDSRGTALLPNSTWKSEGSLTGKEATVSSHGKEGGVREAEGSILSDDEAREHIADGHPSGRFGSELEGAARVVGVEHAMQLA